MKVVVKLPRAAWPREDRATVATAICELEKRGEQVEPAAIYCEAIRYISNAGQTIAELSAVPPTCDPEREASMLHDAFARREFSRKAKELSRIPSDIPLEEYPRILADTDLFAAFPEREEGPSPVNLNSWYDDAPPKLEFVFEGLVPRHTLTGIVAQGGMGKGWLTQELVVSAAIGRKLVSGFQPTTRTRVLWVQSEDPAEEIHRRYKKIVHAFDMNRAEHELFARNVRLYAGDAFPLVKVENGNVMPTEHYQRLRTIVREWKPDLIVVDPLSHFYGGDENDNVAMAAFLNLLKSLGEEANATVWVNHHVSKSYQDELSTAMGRGASAFRDALRCMFAMAPLTAKEIKDFGITDDSLYVRLSHTKMNWTRRTGNVIYLKRDVSSEKVSGVLRVVDLESEKVAISEQMTDRAASELAVIIGENLDNLTVREIAKSKKGADIRFELQEKFPEHGTTRALGRLLQRAESRGFLEIEKKGKAKIPRKSNIITVGFAQESEQRNRSEQEVCFNAQGTGQKELTKSEQMEQGIARPDSYKPLPDSNLQQRDKATPKGGRGAVRFKADAPYLPCRK